MDGRKTHIICSKVEGGGFDKKKLKSKSPKRLLMADYSSLASLPIIPGRPFYAPQVVQYKGFSYQNILQVLLARTSAGNLELLAILLSLPKSPGTEISPI